MDENKTFSSSTNTRKNEAINSAGSEGEINQFDETLVMQNGLAAKIQDSRSTYTPIKSLNTFLFDWKIKARVTKKH